MERPYVEWVRIEGFRCVKAADLRLTPLHALIGPNDSGKSSILRAMQGASGGGVGAGMWFRDGRGPIGGFRYVGNARRFFSDAYPTDGGAPSDTLRSLGTFSVLRLDPDELRRDTKLFTSDQQPWFFNEKGHGLPSLYDALLARDRRAFTNIEDQFRLLFPTVAALRLDNPSSGTKAIGATLVDGTAVTAETMSEGMLYWLAFAIVQHLRLAQGLLIEEPENGLHPARIKEVMRVLRDVSRRTQIILATHSPLVINELRAEEVTIVTRTAERGTICTPMTATKHFATRSKVYALGELWLSYADGDVERELVEDVDTDAAKAG